MVRLENRFLLIWFQCIVVVHLLFIGISWLTASDPSALKGNSKCEILLVKISSPKQKLNQILLVTIEKIKFFLSKINLIYL